jgi:hypothetical protein
LLRVTLKYLQALRQAVRLHIDPETAEIVGGWSAHIMDPYGDDPIFLRSTSV